jgi:hypothetical protein
MVTILISTNAREGEFSALACLRYSHCTLHATLTILITALTIFVIFDKSGLSQIVPRAAIENFFNQVGTHLLRTGNLVLNNLGN